MPPTLSSDLLQVAQADQASRDLGRIRAAAEARAVARIARCPDRYVVCSEHVAEVGPDGRLMLTRFSYAHELDAEDVHGPPPVADAAGPIDPDGDPDLGGEFLRFDPPADLAVARMEDEGGPPSGPTDGELAAMAFEAACDDVFGSPGRMPDEACS